MLSYINAHLHYICDGHVCVSIQYLSKLLMVFSGCDLVKLSPLCAWWYNARLIHERMLLWQH